MKFVIEKKLKNEAGRAGVIETPHGRIETPAFIVVGTKATVKSLRPQDVREAGAQAVLANTYHLMLAPGSDVVRAAGGLHAFMGWDGPVMTDSGGFQAFSLGSAFARGYNKFVTQSELEGFRSAGVPAATAPPLARITDEGVAFRSHIDGSAHLLTPEKSIDIQHDLGADIIFALDECSAPTDAYAYHQKSMERTHLWAERSLARHRERAGERNDQALFGIVQGAMHRDLRETSARVIGGMDFDGFGIGGSYTKEDMNDVLGWVAPFLPEEKPRHLLGIGEPTQLLSAIKRGMDTFDCVAPTREARNGALYTKSGRINIFRSEYRRDFVPIEEGCQCATCARHTRAYLAHLFRARELLAHTLATIHNVHFFVSLVHSIRQSILDGNFDDLEGAFLSRYRGVG